MRAHNFIQSRTRGARDTLRTMRRTPGFTAVAVLSLALGIGANTAAFSLINALILRPLPVEHPEQLVELPHRLSSAQSELLPAHSRSYCRPGAASVDAIEALRHE